MCFSLYENIIETHYKTSRLSHDPKAYGWCLNNRLMSPLAASWTHPFSSGMHFFFLRAHTFRFRRIWRITPTRSSSTRWFSTADTSMYLQSYRTAIVLPAEKKGKFTLNTVIAAISCKVSSIFSRRRYQFYLGDKCTFKGRNNLKIIKPLGMWCTCWWRNTHMSQGISRYGSLTRSVKLQVAHAPGMPGTFSPPPRVSDPDMHHRTCVSHLPWCIPGSLISGFLWSRWRGKRSRVSRRMHNLQFYVPGKRPIAMENSCAV